MMVFIEEFGSVAVLIMFGIAFYKAIKDKTYGGATLIFSFFSVCSLWLFPAKTNAILMGLFLDFPYLVFLVILVIVGLISLSYYTKQQIGRSVLVGLVAIMVPLILTIGLNTFHVSMIANTYQPKVLDQLPIFDKNSVVHTTKKVAITAMQGGNNNSMFKPRSEHLDRTVDDDGVIYISPNTPGTFASSYASIPGFTILRDYQTNGDYIQEIDQDQTYGEGLFWTHGIYHQIYKGTFFANYSKITPIPVTTANGTQILTVADKIGYNWFTNVPKWLGLKVTDGTKFEFLTPDQAIRDPRFENRIIFPRELAIQMVKSQVANKGFWSAILPRTDRIDTDDMGENLQEVLLTSTDGTKHPYYFITAQPEGGKALLHAYLIDGHNGDFSVYNFPRVPSQIGHEQAILNTEAGSSIQPWSDNYTVGMIQYFNGKQGPYWIGSIVKERPSAADQESQQMFVEDVAVSSTQTDQRLVFKTREYLENWMSTGQVVDTVDPTSLSKQLQELRAQEDAILNKLIKAQS